MVPRVFKKVELARGTVNLDIGGGKYETATDYLHRQGVHNFVWDKYNRSLEHNARIASMLIETGCADTATLSNVLNVIKERKFRIEALELAAQALGKGALCYITVYEGNRSGIGTKTTKGYQLNRKLKDYLREVKSVFNQVSIQDGVIYAQNLWND